MFALLHRAFALGRHVGLPLQRNPSQNLRLQGLKTPGWKKQPSFGRAFASGGRLFCPAGYFQCPVLGRRKTGPSLVRANNEFAATRARSVPADTENAVGAGRIIKIGIESAQADFGLLLLRFQPPEENRSTEPVGQSAASGTGPCLSLSGATGTYRNPSKSICAGSIPISNSACWKPMSPRRFGAANSAAANQVFTIE